MGNMEYHVKLNRFVNVSRFVRRLRQDYKNKVFDKVLFALNSSAILRSELGSIKIFRVYFTCKQSQINILFLPT